MVKRIAMLRGINVGAHKRVPMADLVSLFERLKFQNVNTYIQSGNVIFDAPEKLDVKALSDCIEQAIASKFGFEVPVIIRTRDELASIIDGNPYLKTQTDTAQLHVTFLNDVPTHDNILKAESHTCAPDMYSIAGKEVFICCAGKYHQSKLTNDFFEKKLKTNATTRNWNTVLKLYELSQ